MKTWPVWLKPNDEFATRKASKGMDWLKSFVTKKHLPSIQNKYVFEDAEHAPTYSNIFRAETFFQTLALWRSQFAATTQRLVQQNWLFHQLANSEIDY